MGTNQQQTLSASYFRFSENHICYTSCSLGAFTLCSKSSGAMHALYFASENDLALYKSCTKRVLRLEVQSLQAKKKMDQSAFFAGCWLLRVQRKILCDAYYTLNIIFWLLRSKVIIRNVVYKFFWI